MAGLDATPTSLPTANGPPPEEPRKSRKPANTKFKQQQLPAWQPMLTARSVLPFLIAIGLAFIPIGVALYIAAEGVTEIQKEYTNCMAEDAYSQRPCSNFTAGTPCNCFVHFDLPRGIPGPVFIYYGLENFYQNHRKYVKSRDDNQLRGEFSDAPSTDCEPFLTGKDGKKIAPCGAIANSLFNDSVSLKYRPSSDADWKNVDLLRTGIAWNSDRQVKFRNPKGKSLQEAWAEFKFTKPRSWQKEPWQLDESNPDNNGLQNEDFIVWMRTAAFPTFRKLWRRVNHTAVFQEGLPAGNYSLDIQYNYPVVNFEGKKFVIISSVSWIGGRNIFLGVAYMTVGSLCLVLAAVFFFIHARYGKKPTELSALSSRSSW